MDVLTEIRKVADPLIKNGATVTEVRAAVEEALDLRMGAGGKGGHDIPSCPYCGAYGGGGHGGLCPGPPYPTVEVITATGGLALPPLGLRQA